ncbi:MAG: hypothetical protein FD123_1398 [Bacteroidetes bacterium]|nr:MAG: hypothetical protein FD123_1398 [Bacteroidota bacterium]
MKTNPFKLLLPFLAVSMVFTLNSFRPGDKEEKSIGSVAEAEDSLVGKSKNYLQLQGQVRLSKGDVKAGNPVLDSAEVSVRNEKGALVLYGITDHKGRLAFRLPLNRQFMIHFTRKGFVEKKILIDTKVPAGTQKAFDYTFDVDIFPKVKNLDVAVLNNPIAKVNYRAYTKEFTYDATYTNKINSELNKMYREYYAIEKTEADSLNRSRAKSRSGVPASAPRKN